MPLPHRNDKFYFERGINVPKNFIRKFLKNENFLVGYNEWVIKTNIKILNIFLAKKSNKIHLDNKIIK